MGGCDDGSNRLSSMEILDLATGTWSNGPSMSTVRYAHAAAAVQLCTNRMVASISSASPVCCLA